MRRTYTWVHAHKRCRRYPDSQKGCRCHLKTAVQGRKSYRHQNRNRTLRPPLLPVNQKDYKATWTFGFQNQVWPHHFSRQSLPYSLYEFKKNLSICFRWLFWEHIGKSQAKERIMRRQAWQAFYLGFAWIEAEKLWWCLACYLMTERENYRITFLNLSFRFMFTSRSESENYDLSHSFAGDGLNLGFAELSLWFCLLSCVQFIYHHRLKGFYFAFFIDFWLTNYYIFHIF